MTKKEQQIKETEWQIKTLQEKLKRLQALPEFCEDEDLSDIDDFPIDKNSSFNIYLRNKGIRTVKDLIHSTPEVIFSIPTCGKSTLRKITEWMDKHNLEFND